MKREFNDKALHNLYLKSVYRNVKAMVVHKVDYRHFNNKMPGPVNYRLLYQDARLTGFEINNNLQLNYFARNYTLQALLYHLKSETEYDNTRTTHPFSRMKGEHHDQKRGAVLTAFYESAEEPNLNTEIAFEYNREDFQYEEPTNPANSISPVFTENYALRSEASFDLPVKKEGLLIFPKIRSNMFDNILGYWHNRGSIRYDDTNLWGDNYSWRYATSFRLNNPDLVIGYTRSRNYSLPSFYDLYWKGDMQTSGNPDLLPERSNNYRLFGELSSYAFSFRVAYNKGKVDNLIYWFRSITGWKPDNIASALITSYDFSLDIHPFEHSRLSLNYTLTDAVNETRRKDGTPCDFYGKKLPYKPEENLYGELQKDFYLSRSQKNREAIHKTSLSLKMTHSYTGKQWSTLDQLIDPLSPYHLTDIELKLNKPWRNFQSFISLYLKNIFDTQYEIYDYTPRPGFNWIISVGVRR